jgi:hypothetical protein
MGSGFSTLVVDYIANLLALETLIGHARDVKMSFEERV